LSSILDGCLQYVRGPVTCEMHVVPSIDEVRCWAANACLTRAQSPPQCWCLLLSRHQQISNHTVSIALVASHF